MTPQEQQLLDGLIQRVQQTRLPEKDQQAEQMLRQALGQNPDALYILCQTVLVQQYALDQAQAQLTDAKEELEALKQAPPPQQQSHTSFLGGLFGGGQSNTPAPPPPQQSQYAPVNYGAPPPQQYGQPQYGQPQYAPPPPQGGFGGGGGFLQGAMQTAAGVAAGALAFEGIESLMHGFGHSAGYGSDRDIGGFGGGQPEVINNYYEGDRGGHDSGDGFGDRLSAADGDKGLSPDVEDRRGFADTGDDSGSGSGDQFADDGSSDDFSDSDSGDDSGSNDDNY
jgi:hypothetical protein